MVLKNPLSTKKLEKEFDKELEKVLEEKLDLNKNPEASAARLEELRAGRNLGDIPMDDEYFVARNKHMTAYNKGFK